MADLEQASQLAYSQNFAVVDGFASDTTFSDFSPLNSFQVDDVQENMTKEKHWINTIGQEVVTPSSKQCTSAAAESRAVTCESLNLHWIRNFSTGQDS